MKQINLIKFNCNWQTNPIFRLNISNNPLWIPPFSIIFSLTDSRTSNKTNCPHLTIITLMVTASIAFISVSTSLSPLLLHYNIATRIIHAMFDKFNRLITPHITNSGTSNSTNACFSLGWNVLYRCSYVASMWGSQMCWPRWQSERDTILDAGRIVSPVLASSLLGRY